MGPLPTPDEEGEEADEEDASDDEVQGFKSVVDVAIEAFGQDAFVLASHYVRRFKLHQMRLNVLELDVYDVTAFLLIDEEIEKCKAFRMKQAENKMGSRSKGAVE